MARALPPKAFRTARLEIRRLAAGARFGRVYSDRFPDPLGFGKTPSRFSDSRRRVAAHRFGVLYLGQTLKVCFLEALLRDRRDGLIAALPIAEEELHRRLYAEIYLREPLRLVDLEGDGPVKMGVPTDVAKASRQPLARAWSVAFHEHVEGPDGILYPSRLNGHTNLAIYDRAVPKLAAGAVVKLIDAPGLDRVLDDLAVALA
jgi:hypothetical protein